MITVSLGQILIKEAPKLVVIVGGVGLGVLQFDK